MCVCVYVCMRERKEMKMKNTRHVSFSFSFDLSLEIFDIGSNYRYSRRYWPMFFRLRRFTYRLAGSDVSLVISGQQATQRPRMDESRCMRAHTSVSSVLRVCHWPRAFVSTSLYIEIYFSFSLVLSPYVIMYYVFCTNVCA